ncbi:hypothetical protein JXM67_12275 [candidate division WOR-3 bacterium]|nr:hypothetical protein [candidate division WOR-3 bacterium]
MKQRVWYDEEAGAVRLKIIGSTSPDEAYEIMAQANELFKKVKTATM